MYFQTHDITLQRLLDEEVLAVETLIAALVLFMDVLLS